MGWRAEGPKAASAAVAERQRGFQRKPKQRSHRPGAIAKGAFPLKGGCREATGGEEIVLPQAAATRNENGSQKGCHVSFLVDLSTLTSNSELVPNLYASQALLDYLTSVGIEVPDQL